MRKKMLDWFLTDRGKQFSLIFCGGITTTVLLGHVVPNTVLVSQYRDIFRLYSKGFSVPVSKKLQDRFTRTLDLLEIEPSEKQYFMPFMAAGFDVYSMGTMGRFGMHIAIPVNFTYEKVEDIEESKIKINLESVVWSSDAGKKLLDSMVLSESAQMYAMAREIKIRQSFKLFFDTFYAGAACICTYGLSSYLNNTHELISKPRPIRVIGYTFVVLLNIGNYIMTKDLTQNYYEKKIDLELKEKSPVFAEGGKEFYTKILERNKALRVLMGKAGEKTYTVLGNENYYLRNKHMSLVHRKELFENKELPEEKPLKEVTIQTSS